MERAWEAFSVLRRVHVLTVIDRLVCTACLLTLALLPAGPLVVESAAQAPTAEVSAGAPPDELNADIRSALGTAGAKVTIGGTTLEFWWAALTADTWDSVDEGAVVGAMRVTGPFKEIRGKTVAPGVYTLRYGLQPQNGDHLGVSDNREFLLVSPAAADTTVAPLSVDDSVAIAKQTTGTSHPASLSINPAVATDAVLTAYAADPALKGVVFEAGQLRFGLILLGIIEH